MELHDAVLRGYLPEVKRLVEEEKSDMNLRYGDQSLLMIAARNHNLPVVKYLVEQGADMGAITNDHDNSVLLVAVWYHDDVEVPQYFLDLGVDIEETNSRGHTALHCAAHCGHIKTLLLLMSYGANLYARDSRGRLPIDLAKTEEIKQAIRDEEARRDHSFKRIPEADLLLDRAPPPQEADEQKEGVEVGEVGEVSDGDDDDDDDDDDQEEDDSVR